MSQVEQLITDNLDVWTSAIKKRGSQGRGSSKKIELYGIKKLRELILDLAVRGLLVPQDPNDKPASVLLESVRLEKAQLVKENKIKKQKQLPEIGVQDIPYELPSGWVWARFPEVCNYGPGKTPSTKNTSYWGECGSGVPWVSISDMEHYKTLEKTTKYVSQVAADEVFRCDPVKAGTLLMSFKLTVGKISRLEIDAFHNEAIISIYPFSGILQDYIYRFLPERALAGNSKKAIMGNTLNSESLALLLLPIPPEAEQHRIVAKVDELMALCDQLEQQTEDSLSAHQTLVESLLNALLDVAQSRDDSSSKESAFDQAWQRIAEHFDVLFTTEHSIDQLKQAILQLAVMGKLVPQDPNDEPVSLILNRIKNHEQERVKNKEIQKPKNVTFPLPLNIEVPKTWATVLLNDLAFVTKLAGFEYTKYINLKDSGEVPVIRAQNVRPFTPDLSNLKYIDMEISQALPRSCLDRPALLVTFIGAGIGDVCVLDEGQRWHLAPNVAKVEPYSNLNLRYLNIFISSPEGRKELFKSMKSTAQPSLSMTTIREIWFPIPPIEEQGRIVKKVEELMNLCDNLKVRFSESQITQLHLADAMAEDALA